MDKNSESPNPVPESQGEQNDERFDASRRRLAKAGLAAAVLMSLANRPAMGGGSYGGGGFGGGGYTGGGSKTGYKDDKDCRMSAWLSAGSGPTKPKCYGRTCGYWKTKYRKDDSRCWPSPCYSGGYGSYSKYSSWSYKSCNTPSFSSICGSKPTDYNYSKSSSWSWGGGSYGKDDPTLWDVLNDGSGGTGNADKLSAQCAAALLNAADDDIPYGYSVDEIVEIYRAYVSRDPQGLYQFFKLLNERV